jgi:eukaryotic-like serine/threonine-protein kinase
MSVASRLGDEPVPLDLALRVEEIYSRFQSAWSAGRRPRIEDFLGELPEAPGRPALLAELLALELRQRRRAGETPTLEEYQERFPKNAALVDRVFREEAEEKAGPRPEETEFSVDIRPGGVTTQEAEVPSVPTKPSPAQTIVLGRYRITAKLGEGGFGVVYKGYDDELRREVAIKVPHRHRVSQPEDVEAYLAEARVLASLDHPHILPVFDVGRTEDGLCFVVSKFIEGSDLKTRIKEARPSCAESAELLAVVALALHHAHRKGLVHRDVKPGNILVDRSGQPHVADFGLALTEEDFGSGSTFAGTPAYMSPEQACGEGHRVDGRSDIFSLGVVFYELLSGQRPFRGRTRSELVEQITTLEVRPPRQIEDTIPAELERICLKALAKRASERYATALDLADDLRHWLAGDERRESVPIEVASQPKVNVHVSVPPVPGTPPAAAISTPSLSGRAARPFKIIPKGLRSFDANDADFFLELVPGPRDREGLPESIRFWKTRIEEMDPDKTFTVGLIYGPSGCGKSSLVKAGLLPRLADRVIAVYVEATADETEARLLKGVGKNCPNLPADLGLTEALTGLRRGRFLSGSKKVLLVLDQFEQWLHASQSKAGTELVQALRQCDGERVQCLVMVRDDFWLAVSRFMQAVEVRVIEGGNSALVDLFDSLHARKVLAEFGRAFGRLPDNLGNVGRDQASFLDQAVRGLAQEGKVISVRLALFAEMVKGKPWTPATLRDVGGMAGVGVTFLEETFAASTAPPQHRMHQKAAQAILKTLLPETGTDIKGNMRSWQQLLHASGYASRPREFEELLRILDSELRLITPTDPESVDSEDQRSQAGAGEKYYQLTHDYLVPSLRAWLTRKQKETRRGRAELRLAERAAAWNAKPEYRHLPAWWEWLNIRLYTRLRDWTLSQQKMMRKATRYHGLRGLMMVAGLVLATLIGLNIRDQVNERSNAHHAAGLVQRLLDAEIAQVPAIVQEMEDYRVWTDPSLQEEYAKAADGTRQKLHISLALLPVDSNQKEYLCGRLLDAEPHEVAVVRDALIPHQQALLDKLWNAVEQPAKGQERGRLRGACALATYDPDDQRWAKVQDRIASDLVSVPPVYLERWMKTLRPVRAKLVGPLSAILRDAQREPTERTLATNILADYAADELGVLADLLMDADDKQFAVLFPRLKEHGERGLAVLQAEVDKKLPPDAKNDAKEKLAKRQANAAAALLRLNVPDKVWPLLQHSPDPRVRSYLIHRFSPLGADASALVKRLDEEPDVTIRRALILSLGEFGEEAWPTGERGVVVTKMQELYRTAEDAGLHAAVEWLLRQPPCQQEEWLRKTNEAWAKDKAMQEKRLQEIKQVLAKERGQAAPRWYVNGQGQTMVVIPGPVEFLMGSPPTEAGRNPNELQHTKRIGRTFALAAKAVTVEQYRKFAARYGVGEIERWVRTADSPVIGPSWFEAVAYCNWLSQQEGLPESEWCYEPLQDPKAMPALAGSSVGLLAGALGPLAAACGLFPGRTDPEYKAGMKLARNYLQRSGYRLPTEAEMEYAIRAGAVTSRHFGETEELLPRYAWYLKNSQDRTWPVGRLKPNDLGLFDVHGNVMPWCQEEFKNYPQGQRDKPEEDKESSLIINIQDSRVLRGGSFYNHAVNVRSAYRTGTVPAHRNTFVGFRAARTLTTE